MHFKIYTKWNLGQRTPFTGLVFPVPTNFPIIQFQPDSVFSLLVLPEHIPRSDTTCLCPNVSDIFNNFQNVIEINASTFCRGKVNIVFCL